MEIPSRSTVGLVHLAKLQTAAYMPTFRFYNEDVSGNSHDAISILQKISNLGGNLLFRDTCSIATTELTKG